LSLKNRQNLRQNILKSRGISMRIDKFLKVSRVIKRRSVAADACDGGRIEINGKVAKPSKDVKIGDVVTVSFGNNTLRFEVLDVNEKQTKQSAETMYRVIE
jgi:ribosomal 50S subunit-recycling heat shock protein